MEVQWEVKAQPQSLCLETQSYRENTWTLPNFTDSRSGPKNVPSNMFMCQRPTVPRAAPRAQPLHKASQAAQKPGLPGRTPP